MPTRTSKIYKFFILISVVYYFFICNHCRWHLPNPNIYVSLIRYIPLCSHVTTYYVGKLHFFFYFLCNVKSSKSRLYKKKTIEIIKTKKRKKENWMQREKEHKNTHIFLVHFILGDVKLWCVHDFCIVFLFFGFEIFFFYFGQFQTTFISYKKQEVDIIKIPFCLWLNN